jgi:transposase
MGNKNGVTMPRPSKLTPEIQYKIDENVSLGLTYALAANSAGVTYQKYNSWIKRGQTEKSGKYFEFFKHIQKCNADGARKLLERLNDAAAAGNCQVCVWILERRFPDCFGRRIYIKMDVVSENKNENIELIINDADGIRETILKKFALGRENPYVSASEPGIDYRQSFPNQNSL